MQKYADIYRNLVYTEYSRMKHTSSKQWIPVGHSFQYRTRGTRQTGRKNTKYRSAVVAARCPVVVPVAWQGLLQVTAYKYVAELPFHRGRGRSAFVGNTGVSSIYRRIGCRRLRSTLSPALSLASNIQHGNQLPIY